MSGSSIVYFYHSRKYPILILNNYEYKIETRKADKSFWCCKAKDRYRCKARLLSWGKTLSVKTSANHNHPPDFNGSFEKCTPQLLNVEYLETFPKYRDTSHLN
ncbi:pre-mod(mdg4)-O [Rhynchophorus ferrugineus]|uniref:pre-mod(mdg4)-O n=1 Tax=Rhynchophorus ferrugineus TaxID=354439 RepID=UPI003FCCBC62